LVRLNFGIQPLYYIVQCVHGEMNVLLSQVEIKNRKLQELNRFVHYYSRFKNHENSYKVLCCISVICAFLILRSMTFWMMLNCDKLGFIGISHDLQICEATTAKRMKIDTYCRRQNCSPLNVLFSAVLYRLC